MTIDFNAILHASNLLTEGKLVAFPTETVYGLGADARNREAIQNIYRVKKRPATNPLIIHLSDISAIQDFAVHIPEAAYRLAQAFWPGPLTLVLLKHPDVLSSVTAGQNSVALRIPDHPVALALLRSFGGGIAAPSANRYSHLSPTTTAHVRKGLGSEVDFILEGGHCRVGIESTIVSLLEESPVILRQGHIKEHEILQVLGSSESTIKSSMSAKKLSSSLNHKPVTVPGQSLKHYAPLKPLYLVETEILKKHFCGKEKEMEKSGISSAAVLSYSLGEKGTSAKEETEQSLTPLATVPWIKLPAEAVSYASRLYAALHELDQSPAAFILVEAPPNTSEWQAIHDRLKRAVTDNTNLPF